MMRKKLYPKLSKMPYSSTKVSPDRTKSEIMRLLEKYGIIDYQWTQIEGHEYLKFVFDTVVQGKEIKVGVKFDLPEIKALKGRNNQIVSVPKPQVYRMFFYSIKSLLETTKYGILHKEDLFFSYIITQLPNGSEGVMKDLLKDQYLLLPKETDTFTTTTD